MTHAHAPQRHIAIIMGAAVGLYALDWLYGFFFQVHHAKTLTFTRIGNAVEVVWEHPEARRPLYRAAHTAPRGS